MFSCTGDDGADDRGLACGAYPSIACGTTPSGTSAVVCLMAPAGWVLGNIQRNSDTCHTFIKTKMVPRNGKKTTLTSTVLQIVNDVTKTGNPMLSQTQDSAQEVCRSSDRRTALAIAQTLSQHRTGDHCDRQRHCRLAIAQFSEAQCRQTP